MPKVRLEVVKLDYYGTPDVKETIIGAAVLDGISQTKTMQFYLDKMHEKYKQYDENVKGRKVLWIFQQGKNRIVTFEPSGTYIKDIVRESTKEIVKNRNVDFLIKVYALDTENSKLNKTMMRRRVDTRRLISGRATPNRRRNNIKF